MNETKYSTLYKALKDDILSGKYTMGKLLPSENALTRRFKVCRSTVQQAFRELEKIGLISRSRGRGTFVTNQGKSRKIGLIVPGVACTDFFQPIVSEINQLARQEDYTLLFAEVFSMDREERIHQVRELAAEFRQTLEKAGLSVPKDVMLTGFADMPIAALMSPPLTTIRQERDKMGGAAFRRLLERIENPDIPSNEVLFPAPLVVRESTRRSR